MRLTILLLLTSFFSFGQPPVDRYNADLFDVSETNDIQFSSGVPQPNPGGGLYEWLTGYPLNASEYDTSPVDLKMDIFQPTGDTLTKRPLIIIAFGGGFLSGSKDHWSIRLLCQELAKRGYVTASIDYRLGMNIFDADLANRAVYRGLQDARSAVRFFRADAAGANTYKIDPDKIFMGGHSSGGFMALHNAYLDLEEERPLSTYEWIQEGNIIPDQSCLDCVGDNQEFDGHANAVFSLAGALGFTSFIESANDPKVVMFHSTDDGTVPYDSGEPFSSILWAVVGSDLPTVYGSQPISTQANIVGLPYDFYSYSNRGHDVHEDGSSLLYSDIIPGISDWFFEEELKPIFNGISGDTTVCNFALAQEYQLIEGVGAYFDWEITGGSFNSMSTSSNEVTVLWDESAPLQQLTVTPYSILDAKGDEYSVDIQLQVNAINSYNYTNSIWEDPSNWSLGHSPIACEDVIFSNTDIPVVIDHIGSAIVNSIEINEDITLTNMGQLTIDQKSNIATLNTLILQGQLINSGSIGIYSKYPTQRVNFSNSANLINSGTIEVRIKD